jgi:hypothetical protein
MKTKQDDKLIRMWESIYQRFKDIQLDTLQRNQILIMMEDLVIEISRHDCKIIRTRYIKRNFSEYVNKYFYLMADICEDILVFALTFVILIDVLDEYIKVREEQEMYEAAANLLIMKDLIQQQKEKWIIND